MINIREYHREDLTLIKGHLLTLVVCLVLVGAIFWSTHYFDKSAAAELRQVRNQMENLNGAMNKIRSDEGKASEYIDKYLGLEIAGVVGKEDRLQLLEMFAQIRAEHELFPIRIDIGEQAEFVVPYADSDGSSPPIRLRSSTLELNFPLLHEEDLSHVLDDLLASANFLQPAACEVTANNDTNTNFYYLDKHFNASCSMYWYTFDITSAEAAP